MLVGSRKASTPIPTFPLPGGRGFVAADPACWCEIANGQTEGLGGLRTDAGWQPEGFDPHPRLPPARGKGFCSSGPCVPARDSNWAGGRVPAVYRWMVVGSRRASTPIPTFPLPGGRGFVAADPACPREIPTGQAGESRGSTDGCWMATEGLRLPSPPFPSARWKGLCSKGPCVLARDCKWAGGGFGGLPTDTGWQLEGFDPHPRLPPARGKGLCGSGPCVLVRDS